MSKRTSKRSKKRACTDGGLTDELKKKVKLTEEENQPSVVVELQGPSGTQLGSNSPLAETSESNVEPSSEDSATGAKIIPAFGKKLFSQWAGKPKFETTITEEKKAGNDALLKEKEDKKNPSDSSKGDVTLIVSEFVGSVLEHESEQSGGVSEKEIDVDVHLGNAAANLRKEPMGYPLVEDSESRVNLEGTLEKGDSIRCREGPDTLGSKGISSVIGWELGKPGIVDSCNELECEKTSLGLTTGGFKGGDSVQKVGEELEEPDKGIDSSTETGNKKLQAVKETANIPHKAQVDSVREDEGVNTLHDKSGHEGDKPKRQIDTGKNQELPDGKVTEPGNVVGEQPAALRDAAASITPQPGGIPADASRIRATENGDTEPPPSWTDREVEGEAASKGEADDLQAADSNKLMMTPSKADEAGVSEEKESHFEGGPEEDIGTWEAPGCQDMDFTSSQLQQIEDVELRLMGDVRKDNSHSRQRIPLLKERCGLAAVKEGTKSMVDPSSEPILPPRNRPVLSARERAGPTAAERATAQRETEERVENERVKGVMKNMMKDLNEIKLMAGSLLSQMTHYRKHRSQRQPQPSSFLGKKSAPLSFPCPQKGSSTSQFKKF